MSDPLLDALQIEPRLFVLTVKGFSPISIRDQMVRAQWLADRAFSKGVVTANGRVLIVGAGAAGITAGIAFGRLGIETLIVERGTQSFLRQASCSTRWIDPMQYDWPATQWSGVHYPQYSSAPLPWDADWSYRLATRWRMTLAKASRRLPLHISFQTWPTRITTIGPPRAPHALLVELHRRWEEFEVVVWAAGFGREDCSIIDERHGTGVKHTGPAFWSSDHLEKKGCGSSAPNPQVRILGAGDGGVQDCLRALTKRKSAREIVQVLDIPSSVLRAVQTAEERAHRHWIWAGTNGRHDHELYHWLDMAHADAVDEALRNNALNTGLERLMGTNPDNWEDVSLLHRCDHLVCLYALNRFLVLLLDRYLQKFGRRLLLPNGTVVDVDKTQSPHRLDCVQHPLCYDAVNLANPQFDLFADVIIVRYGLDVSSVIPPAQPGVRLSRYRHSIACDPQR
jgi:hypothetical protein